MKGELDEKSNKKYELEINGILVLARKEDGYINVTKLCEANGKRIDNWKRNKEAKDILETFKTLPQYRGIDPLITIVGGNSKIQGTYAHPDIAVQIAQWASPTFALVVSKWVREIALTGTVTVGKEKSNEELIDAQKKFFEKQILEKDKKLSEKDIEIKKLTKKHNKILYKRQCHKFKEGAGFYIVSTENNKFKLGIDELSVNVRFQTYRTLCPQMKVHCIVYSPKCKFIETCMLNRYECKKVELNHEVVEKIDIEHLIDSVKHIIDYFNLDATFESEDELNNYNFE